MLAQSEKIVAAKSKIKYVKSKEDTSYINLDILILQFFYLIINAENVNKK
jgi:hypothetical protein